MPFYKKIPNFLTLVNLLLGCMALVYIYYDHMELRLVSNTGESERAFFDGRVMLESLYLGKMHIAALLVDFLDGFAARILNAASEVGKNLDSLSDVVTFGVVPGVVLFNLLSLSFFDSPFAFELGILAMIPAFFFTLAAAYRLARFNVEHPASYFSGLPVPAAALMIMSLPLALFFNELQIGSWLFNPWLLYGIIAIISLLMISRLRLINLKFQKGSPDNQLRLLLITGSFVLWLAGYLIWGILFISLPVLIFLYILFSLLVKTNPNEISS